MLSNTNEVKQFVDNHIKEVKSIHSVSSRMNIHYDSLRKSFLKNEQVALAEYIVQRKVQAMQQRLAEGDDPCFFICYEFGYREDSGAKIFKKLTGMTMLEYRRKVRSSGGLDPRGSTTRPN